MQDEIRFEIVLANEAHARLIMLWRNDPQTLAMSFHTQPKKWDSFYPEFLEDYFAFPDFPPVFASHEGKRVAFLRFKPCPSPLGVGRHCCEVSINVAPEFRNKGIGSLVLKAVNQWAAQQGIDDLYAEIKPENQSSQKAFLHAGYRQIAPSVKILTIAGEKVPIERFLLSLTPQKSDEGVYVVAEAGSNWRVGNYEDDLKMGKELIQAAAEAGVDAVKFQVFRPETIYVPNAGISDYLSEAGIKEDIRSIFTELSMPYEMIPELASFCREQEVQFMASAFSRADFEAVDPFVTIHKIASYEITHLRLLEIAAKTKKPIFLSTGAATEEEIAWALEVCRTNGSGPVTLLQCTAKYPAEAQSMHLRSIPWLRQRFKRQVGLSDHSKGPVCGPVAAVALGAKVIEKHITMSKSLKGPDHSYALEPSELKEMVLAIRQAEKMLGSAVKMIDESEIELRDYAQRGVQAIQEIQEGDLLQEGGNLEILRPGKQPKGVHPAHLKDIEGKKAKRSLSLGSGLQMGDW